MNLTDSEARVLAAYSAGMTKAEVGEVLFISENTVKKHLSRVSQRFGVHTSRHAVDVAERAGLLQSVPIPQAPPPRPRKPNGQATTPVPADLAQRFTSTTWGQDEWFEVLKADDDLFRRILRGIGKAAVVGQR